MHNKMSNKRIYILNQPVDNVSLVEALSEIVTLLNEGKQQFIIAQNPEKVLAENQDSRLATIINDQATLLPADGVGLVYAAKILGLPDLKRLTGIDLFSGLLDLAHQEGYSIFLYGATKETQITLSKYLAKAYPRLKIRGAIDGYSYATNDSDQEQLIAEINAAKPDFLFVALGSPKQERWLAGALPKLKVKLAMGVGGSFDVLAGNVKRAPSWMQEAGLEWLYRLIKQPSRILRAKNLPIFLIKVIGERLRIGKR